MRAGRAPKDHLDSLFCPKGALRKKVCPPSLLVAAVAVVVVVVVVVVDVVAVVAVVAVANNKSNLFVVCLFVCLFVCLLLVVQFISSTIVS